MDQSTSKWHINFFLGFFLSFFFFSFCILWVPREEEENASEICGHQWNRFFSFCSILCPFLGLGFCSSMRFEQWTCCHILTALDKPLFVLLYLPWETVHCLDALIQLNSCVLAAHDIVMAPVSCSFRRVVFMYCLWNVPTTRFDGICRGNLFRGLIHEMGMLTWPAWAPANKLVTWRDAGNGFCHWIQEQALLVSFPAFMQHIFCFCLL